MGKSKKQKTATSTTSLSSQLANLKKSEPAPVVAHTYVSFLFERQQASLISTDTIWNLANEGLSELTKLDSRFSPFEHTLFSFSSKQLVRDLQTRDENQKLDASIGSFLQLLSPYFMQKSAHKVIEYLLRRYSVDQYNVDQIFSCILPYHETNLFGRMVQILRINESALWSFLAPIKKSGTPLSHELLIERCLRDFGLIEFICSSVKSAIAHQASFRTLTSFYGVLLTQILAKPVQLDNDLLNRVMPYIFDGLHSNNLEYQLASYMIVSQISYRSELSSGLLDSLLDSISKYATDLSLNDSLLCVIFLTQSQSISKFTSKTILNLSKQSQFPLRLVTLFQKGYDMSKFLSLYFKEAMQLSFKEPTVFQMLNKIIVDVPLHSYIVDLTCDFVEGYLKHYSSNKSSTELDDSVNKFIKLVDRKYPQDLDKALSQNLKKYADNKEKKAILNQFMNKVFSGTRHELLGNSDSTLFLSLEHPEATIRLNALQQLKQIISKNKEFSPSDNQYIQDAVARRLVDENEDVVKFILQNPVLFQQVDSNTLLETSKSMLNSESHSEDIKYSVLLFLSSHYTSSSIDPATMDTVLALVLRKVVDDTILSASSDNSQSINKLVKLLENIDHPLVANVSSIKDDRINNLVELVGKNYAAKFDQVKDKVSNLMQDAKVKLLLVASLNVALSNANTSNNIKQYIINEVLAPLCISKVDDIKESGFTPSLNATPIEMIRSNGQLIYNTIANVIRRVSINEIELLRNIYLSLTSLNGVSFKCVFELVSLILQTHFRANPLQFLVYFWTNYGDNSNITELSVFKSLEYCNGYLKSLESLSYDFQLLLPSLLITLRHDSKMIRSATLNCLSSMNIEDVKSVWCKDNNNLYAITKLNDSCYLNSDLYTLLISSICNQSQGLLQDNNFVLSILSQISSISKKEFTSEKMSEVQKYFIQHSAYIPSIYAKLTLLQIVSNCKPSSEVLNTYKSTLVDDLLKSNAINKNTSLLIRLLIKQFNSNNIKLVEGDAYKTLLHILDSVDVNILVDNRQLSVKKLLIEELNISKLYSKLTLPKQKELFFRFCKLIMSEQNGTIRDEVTKLLQSVELDADFIISELLSHFNDEDTTSNTKVTPKSKKQKSSQFTKMDDIVGQLPKLNIPLEILNISDIKIRSSETLIKPLFQILSFLVEKVTFKKGDDIEYSVEYSKQILLTSLISIIQNVDKSLFKSIQTDISVESLLYCLKDSSNPQTHQKVLLLLSAISPIFPSLILDQIMPLFTYMGASVLTQDDNYTFQVIQKTVESIIPSIIESGSTVKSVLDIFVKSINNIPVHRRVHLFQVLLRTVSSKYIPGMLLLLLNSHLANSATVATTTTTTTETTTSTNLVAFTHNLLNEFAPYVVTKSLMEVLTFAVHIPVDSTTSIRENAIANKLYDFCPLKVEKDLLTICLMKQIIMEFITDHIASKTFLDKLLHYESEEEQQTIQKLCLQLLELLLELQQQATIKSKEKKSTQYNTIWKGIIDMGYTAIDNLNQLLSVSAFVNAISQLLQNPDDKIRRRALVLFNEKISQEKDTLTDVEYESFIGMIDQLAKLVETSENDVNKQSALLSLEILARNFGSRNSNGFLKLVPMLIKTMCNSNPQVATSSVICLATLTTELGSLIIPYLPQFFPVLLKTIQGSFATTTSTTDVTKNKLLLQLSCLSSLEVIISQTSNFLNPYLNQILSAITHPNVVNSSNEKINVKVKSLMSIIASNVPARLLLPAVFSLYNTCISYSTSQSMLYLLDMLGDICSRLNQPTIQSQHRTIFKFFLLIFDYRQKKPDSESIDKVENKAVSAFLSLIIKLNETLFKPIFLALFDWAISTPNNIPRLVVFYRTLEALSDKLKSISIPYFGYVLDNSIELLSTQFANNDNIHHNQLFRFLVSSLYRCFLYDTDGFINKEKFDKLLPVLAQQLESVEENVEEYEDRMLNYLIPCLAQLAVCVGNDKLWKPLNYQVLLKTRSESSKVRYMALKVIEECYSKLGEELLVLLPETIPFLAELLEDSDSKVEKLCQDLIKSIETYLGTDSLSNYL